MADKKEKGPELQKLLEQYDFEKNKNWRELEQDHVDAHSKGMKNVKNKIGMNRQQIHEEVAKYIEGYETHIHGDTKGFKDYRKKLSRSEAEKVIEQLQRNGQGFDYASLQKEGINKVLEAYRDSKRGEDFSGYRRSITSEFVDPQDKEAVESLTKQLIKHDPAKYSPKDSFEIQKNIHGHLAQAGFQYQNKMLDQSKSYVPKDKKKK